MRNVAVVRDALIILIAPGVTILKRYKKHKNDHYCFLTFLKVHLFCPNLAQYWPMAPLTLESLQSECFSQLAMKMGRSKFCRTLWRKKTHYIKGGHIILPKILPLLFPACDVLCFQLFAPVSLVYFVF